MTRPPFHSTWTRLRSLDDGRPWMRRSELLAAVKAAGVEVTEWRLRKELARLPRPEKRHAMYRYSPAHLAAVVQALRSAANRKPTE